MKFYTLNGFILWYNNDEEINKSIKIHFLTCLEVVLYCMLYFMIWLVLFIGTGTNACYIEKLENVELWDGDNNEPKQVRKQVQSMSEMQAEGMA